MKLEIHEIFIVRAAIGKKSLFRFQKPSAGGVGCSLAGDHGSSIWVASISLTVGPAGSGHAPSRIRTLLDVRQNCGRSGHCFVDHRLRSMLGACSLWDIPYGLETQVAGAWPVLFWARCFPMFEGIVASVVNLSLTIV